MQKRVYRVAVIGAGVSGLAASVRLAVKGWQVDLFEKEAYPGGKLAELRRDGFRFDLGPSLFTQPERVLELFRLSGEDPADHFTYRQLDVVCRYFWPDGTRLDVPADPDDFVRECRRVFPDGSDALAAYLDAASLLYQTAAPLFIDQPFPTRAAFMSPEAQQIGRNPFLLDPFITLHRRNARTFSDPRLVQLFDRYATYNGSNPYKAPATLKMIAHLEHNQGAYYPAGGMYSIARELAALAIRKGVRFHYQTAVQRVNLNADGNQITGIRLKGKDLPFDAVVSDVDITTFYRSGMVEKNPPVIGRNQALSTSAVIFYWGIRGSHDELDLHNILFASDYREEFRHLFRLKRMYIDPTIYIYISSRVVPEDAPPGHENWFVMVNAPVNAGQDWDAEIAALRTRLIGKIRQRLGIDLSDQIVTEHIEDPRTIEGRTGSGQGALYGNSSNSRISAFSRHPNRRSKLKGLYFAGGSVHPGGGIPLCLASAKIVTDLIDKNIQYDR